MGIALAIVVCSGLAEPTVRTWANPLDLDYPYSFEQMNDGISYRTGADPAVVSFGDAYYLFATLADGYWTSTDLVDWQFVKADMWPLTDPVAPAPLATDGKLIVMQSAMEPAPLLFSTDPAHGHWDFWTRLFPPIPGAASYGYANQVQPGELPPGPWDPALFRDGDGKTYLYWGSSNVFPLYGAQIDLNLGARGAGKRVTFVSKPSVMLALDPAAHGWERFGRDHRDESVQPFVEGAWMNRHAGRYYLQYAAPGTENNVYATGVYVAPAPLGPFTYAPYNPVGYKPGGFAVGAGHGSTFRDAQGNYWNTGTAWIGVNWNFERRIVMFPAAFHDDGQMWIDTRFGDFPQRLPDHPLRPGESTFTGWMLLSYRKAASATSTQEGYDVSAVTDENPRTFWVSGGNVAGEAITIDLGGERTVRAVQVDYADFQSDRYGNDKEIYTQFTLDGSRDGVTWTRLVNLSEETRDRPNAYVELTAAPRLRYLRYVHDHVGSDTLAISDLRIFGNADGKPPAAPVLVAARRSADGRATEVTWKSVPGAVGYNVRWGTSAARLHSTYQRFADQPTTLELRALNKGVKYVIAVEAFDERGVSPLSRTITLAP